MFELLLYDPIPYMVCLDINFLVILLTLEIHSEHKPIYKSKPTALQPEFVYTLRNVFLIVSLIEINFFWYKS